MSRAADYIRDALARDGVTLLDVGDRATTIGEYYFIAAPFWVPDGWESSKSEALEDYTNAYLPLGVHQDGENVLEYANAIWVRARLPIVFGFAPPTCRQPIRQNLLDVSFLAIHLRTREITPFALSDRQSRAFAELRFGPTSTPERQRHIAATFWAAIAAHPESLANYRDRFISNDGHDEAAATVGYWRGMFHEYLGRW